MPIHSRPPAYTLHKPTGQARVRIAGRDHYLGVYGTPESHERYDHLIAELLHSADQGADRRITVGQLIVLYMKYARSYYVKCGQETSEVNNLRVALRPLAKLFRSTLAADFSPKKLKNVRDEMIRKGCVRTSINRQVDRIRRMFKWAVSEEIVSSNVYVVRETLGRDLSPAQGWRWCRRGLVPISRGIPSEIDCDVIDAELEQHGIL